MAMSAKEREAKQKREKNAECAPKTTENELQMESITKEKARVHGIKYIEIKRADFALYDMTISENYLNSIRLMVIDQRSNKNILIKSAGQKCCSSPNLYLREIRID